MSINDVSLAKGRKVAVPAGVVSGDPVLVGVDLIGTASTDRDSDGNALVNLETGRIVSIPVKGIDGAGNSAVALGDPLYIVMADTPHVSKKATGVRFGSALGTVTSGGTAGSLEVLIRQ